MKITKKGCNNKPKINIKNYLMRKKIKKENLEEINAVTCQKKINKNRKNTQQY